MFAAVTWLKEHHAKLTAFGKPVELWWKDLYEDSLEPFIPLQLLVCQSVNCEVKFEMQSVYAVVPDHIIRTVYTS